VSDDDAPIIEAEFHPAMLTPELRDTKSTHSNLRLKAHPEWVEELAFVCWIESDRNIRRAMRLYTERQQAKVYDGEDPAPDVAYQTWVSWKNRHNWEMKADAFVAANFPGLRMRHIARVMNLNTIAIEKHADILHRDNVKDQDMLKAIEMAYQTTGLGTWGSRERLAPTVKVVEAIREDLDDLDERELGRLAMEAIRKTRNTDPERRKR
jgi:hypothetical protein